MEVEGRKQLGKVGEVGAQAGWEVLVRWNCPTWSQQGGGRGCAHAGMHTKEQLIGRSRGGSVRAAYNGGGVVTYG